MSTEPLIIDSQLNLETVLAGRQHIPAPLAVLERQRMVSVTYYSFDGCLHQGQIVVDVDLVADIPVLFETIRKNHFPIASVIPFVDRTHMTEAEKKIPSNNTSGFNYRMITGTDRLSNHAFGRAIDINPLLNPFIKGETRIPPGALYDTTVPGTLTADGAVVAIFKKLHWTWGGDWDDLKDYMHFEKNE